MTATMPTVIAGGSPTPAAGVVLIDPATGLPYVASGGGGGGGAVTVAQLPAALGPQASAASLSVAPATDAVFSVADPAAHTYQNEIATDTGVIRTQLTALSGQLPAASEETPVTAASDDATAGDAPAA